MWSWRDQSSSTITSLPPAPTSKEGTRLDTTVLKGMGRGVKKIEDKKRTGGKFKTKKKEVRKKMEETVEEMEESVEEMEESVEENERKDEKKEHV